MPDTPICPTCGTPLATKCGEDFPGDRRRPDNDGQTCWLACPVCDAGECAKGAVVVPKPSCGEPLSIGRTNVRPFRDFLPPEPIWENGKMAMEHPGMMRYDIDLREASCIRQ